MTPRSSKNSSLPASLQCTLNAGACIGERMQPTDAALNLFGGSGTLPSIRLSGSRPVAEAIRGTHLLAQWGAVQLPKNSKTLACFPHQTSNFCSIGPHSLSVVARLACVSLKVQW